MPQISITVHNGEFVRKGLENLRSDVPRIARSRMWETVQNIIRLMKIYPPQPAGSKYVRTFTLRRSWKGSAVGALAYKIEADPVQRGRHYGKYVVGNAYGQEQAAQNSHWQLFRGVVEKQTAKLPKSIQNDIGLAVKRRGLG